jgi:hypothetical protein
MKFSAHAIGDECELHVHEPRRPEASSARPYVNFDIASSRAMHSITIPDASMGGHCAATVEPSQWPSD